MPGWILPSGLVGQPDVIRVFSGSARNDGCPAKLALKARPDVRARIRRPYKPEKLETFFLAPVMAVLDLAEHREMPLDKALGVLARPDEHVDLVREDRIKPVHGGVLAWTAHAVSQFLEAWTPPENDMRPVRGNWVDLQRLRYPDHRGARQYELKVWGRGYVSADGQVRELRLPTTRAGRRPRSDAELAVIARVLSTGTPAFPAPGVAGPANRIRVVEIGCADGSASVVYERTSDEAARDFAEHGRDALSTAVDGTTFLPGQDCVDCKYSGSCPALPRVPGVLGISDSTKPRRSWSVTNGRRYRECAAHDHLRRVQLPRSLDIEYGPSAMRGKVLHRWLKDRHARRPLVPCRVEDAELWTDGENELPEEEQQRVRLMIKFHSRLCPLRHLSRDARTKVEETLVFDDTEADVAIIAEPDLLYEDSGAWVWREVKTTSKEITLTRAELLGRYPQLALAVALLSRSALGGRTRGARVELELLSPAGPEIDILDPADPLLRERASAVLHDLVRRWHGDQEFVASPDSYRCSRCEVAAWCPSSAEAV